MTTFALIAIGFVAGFLVSILLEKLGWDEWREENGL